ncbi:MAG: M28 family peptidase [Chryseolinea sp.]
MKQTLPLLLLLFTCFTACKQKQNLNDTFTRLDDEIKKNSKAYVTLEEATSTIGHRLTGSPNGTKAEEYVFNKFKEYGFQEVSYQNFEVEAWSRGDLSVQIDGDSVPAVTLGHAPVKSEVTGELVDVGSGLEADYTVNPDAVKGKIAFLYIGILPGSTKDARNLHRSEKTAIAIRHGAIGVIIYNQVDGGVMFTGTASVTGSLLDIPAICIPKEQGFALKEKLKTKKVSAHIAMTNHSDVIKARNVVATLKGSELPDERILVGGHLDSWDLATGAIDNGIGSFSVLDMARAFKANNLQPRRTVQFIMFMGEEQGLLGSTFMVNEAVKDGSIENIKYMMNLDMTGNPIGINAGGNLDDTTFFHNLGAEVAKVDTIFRNTFSPESHLHSDHQPFMLEGIPVLGLVGNLDEAVYGCYHANCDDFKLVNEDHLLNTARFGTMILYGLSNAEKLPASKMNPKATKQFLIDSHLEEPLRLAGDWRWE